MFDPMADLADSSQGDDPLAPMTSGGGGSYQGGGQGGHHRAPRARGGFDGGSGGGYADEVHSITIRARQRTFYLDLKQSGNGKFFKLSEKSRGGKKTTIMFDVEDLPHFIKAFQDMQTHV